MHWAGRGGEQTGALPRAGIMLPFSSMPSMRALRGMTLGNLCRSSLALDCSLPARCGHHVRQKPSPTLSRWPPGRVMGSQMAGGNRGGWPELLRLSETRGDPRQLRKHLVALCVMGRSEQRWGDATPSSSLPCAVPKPEYLHIQIGRLNQDFCSTQCGAAIKALNRTTYQPPFLCLFVFLVFCLFFF